MRLRRVEGQLQEDKTLELSNVGLAALAALAVVVATDEDSEQIEARSSSYSLGLWTMEYAPREMPLSRPEVISRGLCSDIKMQEACD